MLQTKTVKEAKGSTRSSDMGGSMGKSKTKRDYRVCKEAMDDPKKFNELARWGRMEIEIAESEMPGLMSIRKPAIPGLIHLFWPFIVWFTNGIFAQDRRIVELEQQAHDAQGGDWNQEIFPVIRALREVLVARGVRN